MGQSVPCYVYRLVMKGTAEEKVHNRQIMKESMSGHILDGKEMARKFKKSEVKELLDLSNICPEEAPKKTYDDIDPILSQLLQENLLYDWELQKSSASETSLVIREPAESKQNARIDRPRRTIVSINFYQHTYLESYYQ